jgi:hypothetical protein
MSTESIFGTDSWLGDRSHLFNVEFVTRARPSARDKQGNELFKP